MDGKSIKSGLAKLAAGGNIRKLIIISGIAGMALIFLSSFTESGSLFKTSSESDFSVSAYSAEIEDELQSAISKIEGAGETQVLLTMENSVEYVYLDDSTSKTKEIEPIIRGVLVVCEGGDDPVVVERISGAVTKALDISAAKVCITKLSE